MDVQTLEKFFNERFDREMGKIVDTVEDRIQSASLTAIDNFFAPRFELAVRSINASSGQDAASVTGNSELEEGIGITASFENVSESNNTFDHSNANCETRGNTPSEVSDKSVSRTHFDRQSRTHHSSHVVQRSFVKRKGNVCCASFVFVYYYVHVFEIYMLNTVFVSMLFNLHFGFEWGSIIGVSF